MTELDVRSHLAKLNFRGEDVFKPCAALSGGELARLRFAEILLERPNLLFLDEPTNHLDIYTRETLTEALSAYEGALVLVTHDRYLMNALACPILYLEDTGAVRYDSYDAMMHRTQSAPAEVKPEKKEPAKPAYGKEQRRKRAQLREKIKKLEDELEALELQIVDYEAQVSDPEVLKDHVKLHEVCDALEDARFRQEEALNEWEQAVEEQEAYEQAENSANA